MDDIKEKAPELSGEQQSDLMQLERLAAEGEQENAVTGAPGQVEPQRPPLDKEIAGMLQMASAMIGPMFPSVAKIYTPEICEAVGVAVAPVCEKHGWLQGGIGGKYGEELMALFIVGPLVWKTGEAVKADIAARKAEKPAGITAEKPVGQLQEPGQKTVTFGAPV